MWKAVTFLILGSLSLIFVIVLALFGGKKENEETDSQEQKVEEQAEKSEINDGGNVNEENNINS